MTLAQDIEQPLIEALGDGRFRVTGELCFATVKSLRDNSQSVFDGSEHKLDFDLSGVSRADSAGLALLLEWMRMAQSSNHTIHYLHLPEQLMAIARACNLEDVLPLD